ncbi:alpha-1,2-fucosyltransferase [Salinibacter grassmerensis]|uniref:alpha-1,2-fucosyltransferase n=1 Tax=Salinibacter grassmerensis TaxID=3040353 RepID=UPI003C6E768D
MPTVIVHGGVGNQLFQYAAGRALSLKTGARLYLETSTFARSSASGGVSRTLRLPRFSVQGQLIRDSVEDRALLEGRFKLYTLLRRASPRLALQTCRVHRDLECPRHFAPHVLEAPGSSLLYGYYQSERYFRPVADTLRTELTLRDGPDGENQRWKSRIEEEKSVSVHVRRGDYTRQGWTLPPAYYRSAIQEMRRTIERPRLFFFSDEMDWVTAHIGALLPDGISHENVRFVEGNEERACEDLRLMKACSHNIISNSTFSWWGAWLNRNERKTVLAPAQWLPGRARDSDIIPERWRTVDF